MILYGGSGHAKVIRDAVKASGDDIKFIFDDDPALTRLNETPVVGPYRSEEAKEELLIIAIGDNLTRKRVSQKIGHRFGKAIHPTALISSYSKIEPGTVVFHNSVIQAGVRIGRHCIINTAAIVEHDCYLGDFIHISPNTTLCGNVRIGDGTHIGAGAVIIPNISIGKWCIIGAGAVVTQNIPDYSMVTGVPGKVVRKLTVTI